MSNNVSRVGKVGNSQISIGRFTYGIEKSSIMQWGEGSNLEVGQFCSIADKVTFFLGGNHRIDWVTTFPFGHIYQDELGGSKIKGHPSTKGDIIIGNDVWIGSGVTIMSGIKVGDGAVLAANSTVVCDVQPYQIFGGNPAKLLKNRFDDEIIDLLLTLRWWDLNIDDIRDISQSLCSQPSKSDLKNLIKKYR